MQVWLDRDRLGRPHRIITMGLPHKYIPFLPGAVISKSGGKVTLPPDELYGRYLINQQRFPGVEASPDFLQWLDDCASWTKEVIDLASLVEYEGNPKLRPFQRVDVAVMKKVPYLINGNQMGTGKTVESLAFVKEMNFQRVLVFCRRTKMLDWKEEAEIWVDSDVEIVRGTSVQKKKIFARGARIRILSYGALRVSKDSKTGVMKYTMPEIFADNYDLVIFDEAHWLKSKRAQQTKGAGLLKCDRIHLLTGSPMKDRPQDIFALLSLVDPRRWTSYNNFVERFCEYAENFFGGKNITGIKNAKHLQYILASVMIRRLKSDVMSYLPEKIYKTVHVELTPAQRKLYTEMEKTMTITADPSREQTLLEFLNEDDKNDIVASNAMTKMIRLRQICNSPSLLGLPGESAKTATIVDLITEALACDEKVVVFSIFVDYIELLSNELDKLNISHSKIHGQISEAQLDKAKLLFRSDPDCKVMLSTLGSGSEGLNLQNASVLIFADKPWTPGDLSQAEDRVHREGQTTRPLIISVVCKNTVEEYIEELLQHKEDIISQAMAVKYIWKKILEAKL